MSETNGTPRTISAAEIAREIGVSKRWVVLHHAELPFARKLSRKVIVYDRAGFERWWATAGAGALPANGG